MPTPAKVPTFEEQLETLHRAVGPGFSPELDDYVDQLRADTENREQQRPAALPSTAEPAEAREAPDEESHSESHVESHLESHPAPVDLESETAGEGDLQSSEKNTCAATKKNLSPCGAYPIQGSPYCYYHDPANAEKRHESQARGGQNTRPLPAIDIAQMTVHLKDQLSVQAIVEGVLRMQLAGAIPTRQASQILRTLRIAERNVPESWMLKNGGSERYNAILKNFLETAGLIEESLDELDVHERESAILDTGAKRAEYLGPTNSTTRRRPNATSSASPQATHTPSPTKSTASANGQCEPTTQTPRHRDTETPRHGNFRNPDRPWWPREMALALPGLSGR